MPDALPVEKPCAGCDELKLQVDYLTKQYGFYTGHMNQVFNFYLIACGLLANAFVQSRVGSTPFQAWASVGIAVFGILLTIIFFQLHQRAFAIAGVLDKELEAAEVRIGVGFMKGRKKGKNFFNKNTTVFRAIYFVVFMGFLIAAAYAYLVPNPVKPG